MTINNFRKWWDVIIEEGKKIGYYVNEAKSWLILKDPSKRDIVDQMFEDTEIKVTTEGKRHLGAALGTEDFRRRYAAEKVSKWCTELHNLSEIAKHQPQAAYAAFTHGERHHLTYFLRTIKGMEDVLKPLDDIISQEFLPVLLGKNVISDANRELYSLPLRHGGLGIPVFCESASEEYNASTRITVPLVAIMMMQGRELPNREDVFKKRREVKAEHEEFLKNKVVKMDLELHKGTARHRRQACEKGASSWLSVLPLSEQGFTLAKGEFRDALALRYGDTIADLPSQCPCGENFSMTHALNCKRGGFIIMRHNNIRDFEANLMHKVCNDVEVEPRLQPLDGEAVNGLEGDEARPDIRARGMWRTAQNAYFDDRV